jgi:phosphatidylserine decarboxylase
MIKEGYTFSAGPLLLGVLAVALGWKIIGCVLISLGLFVLYFFRDPERRIPGGDGDVVSPADGRVVVIAEEPFNGRQGTRISIFLAVWNVHVQRAPLAGRITEVKYRPGRFHAAMRARASEENEQNVFRLETPAGEVVFKQIAGWIARRVVSWKKKGDAVARGERVGMIRFGSRVDVWLPAGAEIRIRKGQNVAGGSTILARWP